MEQNHFRETYQISLKSIDLTVMKTIYWEHKDPI